MVVRRSFRVYLQALQMAGIAAIVVAGELGNEVCR